MSFRHGMRRAGGLLFSDDFSSISNWTKVTGELISNGVDVTYTTKTVIHLSTGPDVIGPYTAEFLQQTSTNNVDRIGSFVFYPAYTDQNNYIVCGLWTISTSPDTWAIAKAVNGTLTQMGNFLFDAPNGDVLMVVTRNGDTYKMEIDGHSTGDVVIAGFENEHTLALRGYTNVSTGGIALAKNLEVNKL